jgi:hypothetical protein
VGWEDATTSLASVSSRFFAQRIPSCAKWPSEAIICARSRRGTDLAAQSNPSSKTGSRGYRSAGASEWCFRSSEERDTGKPPRAETVILEGQNLTPEAVAGLASGGYSGFLSAWTSLMAHSLYRILCFYSTRPFSWRYSAATSSGSSRSMSTWLLSLRMVSASRLSETEFRTSSIFGFCSRASVLTTGAG